MRHPGQHDREIRRRRHSCGGRPRPAGCRFPGSICLRSASGSISVTWYTPLIGVSHRHQGRGVLDFGDQGPYPSGPVGHIRIRVAIAESQQRPVLCSCGLVGRHCASGPGMVGSQSRYYSSYTRTPHLHLTGPHTPTPTRHTRPHTSTHFLTSRQQLLNSHPDDVDAMRTSKLLLCDANVRVSVLPETSPRIRREFVVN